jgi:hypothetical protein
MYSFRRLALLLALACSAISLLPAQNSSSSSNATPGTSAPQDQQAPTAAEAQQPNQPQISVQARIKARRDKRRADAIHDAYGHLYEGYVGAGYLRFRPGAILQRVNEYDWNVGLTRYYNERFGVTVDGRGYYGTPFIEPQEGNPPAGDVRLDKPAISQYAALIGPTYRFYLQPKYAVSGRVLAGYARGNFTGDTNGFGTLGVLYPDASTFAASASIFVDYNVAPNIALRVAPEYYATGFGSTVQNNLGYTIGLVIRVGRQK